jgi:hypothetical protein
MRVVNASRETVFDQTLRDFDASLSAVARGFDEFFELRGEVLGLAHDRVSFRWFVVCSLLLR